MTRFRAALKVLTSPQVIVVTKGFSFNTYDNARCIQSDNYVLVEVGERK